MDPETLYFVHTRIVPTTLSLLPARMNTPPARAMLLAIGLQESGFIHRVQVGGPAHGFWQFEKGGGVRGVLGHAATQPLIHSVCDVLRYPPTEAGCYAAIVHNDVLACAFARLLLWTVPGALALPHEPQKGWTQYLSGWRPGKPHPEKWDRYFAEAWRTVRED